MPADLESMFFKGETPWHGLGTKVEGALTAEQAIVAAGLDWDVSLKPLAIKEREECSACNELDDNGETRCNRNTVYNSTAGNDYPLNFKGKDGCKHECHKQPVYSLGQDVDRFATIRSRDNKLLGVVGPDWRPLQNAQAFAWFDPFVQSGAAEYHTAGSLKGGSVIWVLAEIKNLGDDGKPTGKTEGMLVVPGDAVRRFILLSNAHDGTQAVRCGYTTIRVVCANTLAQAHNDGASRLIKVRHTESVESRLKAIRDIMKIQQQAFVASVEQYRFLAQCHDVSKDDLARYVRIVFFGSDKAEDDSVGARILNAVGELFYKGYRQQLAGVKGTMWAAYNAVTEYLNYKRGNTPENRLHNVWFGDSVGINDKALSTAVQLSREKLGVKPSGNTPRKILLPSASTVIDIEEDE